MGVVDTLNVNDTVHQKQELCSQYENLNLSDEQRKGIGHWIDAIHAQDETYTAVVFRMAMQCCFALILDLMDLNVSVKSSALDSQLVCEIL